MLPVAISVLIFIYSFTASLLAMFIPPTTDKTYNWGQVIKIPLSEYFICEIKILELMFKKLLVLLRLKYWNTETNS